MGSLFGGAVGSLFGGKKPKRPATKEKLALNLGGYADGDMSYTLPGDWSGDATAQKVTDYYAVLAHSWNGMGQDVEDRFVSTITGAAQSAVEQAQSLQKLLPESYSEAFQKELQDRPIEFFYRYRDKDIDDDTLTEIAAEIQEETNRVMLSAFQALDFSEYAGKIDVDQSSLEGMTLPTAAYNGCRSFLEMADDAWAFHPGFWAGGNGGGYSSAYGATKGSSGKLGTGGYGIGGTGGTGGLNDYAKTYGENGGGEFGGGGGSPTTQAYHANGGGGGGSGDGLGGNGGRGGNTAIIGGFGGNGGNGFGAGGGGGGGGANLGGTQGSAGAGGRGGGPRGGAGGKGSIYMQDDSNKGGGGEFGGNGGSGGYGGNGGYGGDGGSGGIIP